MPQKYIKRKTKPVATYGETGDDNKIQWITKSVGTFTGGGGGGTGTVDTEMSDTSTNAVQNKIIKEYVDTVDDNLTKVMPTDINVDSNGCLILEHDGQEITGQKKLVTPLINKNYRIKVGEWGTWFTWFNSNTNKKSGEFSQEDFNPRFTFIYWDDNSNQSICYLDIPTTTDEVTLYNILTDKNVNTYITGKLDKSTSKKMVYVNDEDGNPAMLEYSLLPGNSNIAQFDTNGHLYTESPSIDTHAANKKYVDTAITNIKTDIDGIMSPNLFNAAEAKENTAIDENYGNEVSFDGWLATGYIPVTKNDVLYFSSNGNPISYSTGAFYDKDKQVVGAFGNPNMSNNITVTSDGYARFSFGTAPVNLQIEKGSRTAYVPYGELKITAEVNEIKSEVEEAKTDVNKVKTEVLKIQEDHTNLFNKDAVVKGAVFADSGYFDPSFSSWDTSDYIPVKPGMVLYFSSNELPIGVVSTGAYFDADKKYLSGVNNEPTVLTVPDGAYYLRFSKNGGLGDTLNTLKIEQYGITKFTPYGELYVTVKESALPSSILPKWKGLKILTLGDSITAMGGVNGWTYWIKQYLSADKVVNVSVAGSTWQDKVANQTYDGNPQSGTDGNVMGNQVQKVLNAKANGDADYQDFDVITFSFGTNDSVDFSVQTKESVESQFITNYAQDSYTVVPLESVNRQTLAGAMRYGFQKLHEAYPNAVIFMCTPTQECYETFDSIYKKGDFINFVADRLGAETIDTRRCGIRNIYESPTTIDYDHPDQSGVSPIQTDLLDGIHTNENGAKKIAKYNAREIMKYFMID